MKNLILLSAFLLLISVSCKKDKPRTYPTDGLISYVNFDDNLKDQQGYANDGVGTATFGAGKTGKAAVFNGTNQDIKFAPKTPQINNKISVSFWFKSAGTTPDQVFLSLPGIDFGTETQDQKVYLITQGTGINGNINVGEWNHAVFSYDGVEMRLFVNGTLKNSKLTAGMITGFNSDLLLGSYFGIFWAGSIDNLFIYNRAITQAEVSQLYNYK